MMRHIMSSNSPSTAPSSNETESVRSGASSVTSPRPRTGTSIYDANSVWEYGRQFNGYRQGKYLLPIDADEQDRLDLQHHIWLLVLDGHLTKAPFASRDPPNVLDIGTGTGIWAKQFARHHPGSTVIGTDLSLIQTQDNLPPNVSFVREDSEELWVFDHLFDYIHWRAMSTCFNNIKGMFPRIFDHLVPGGWAEFHENGSEVIGEDAVAEAYVRDSPFAASLRYAIAGGAIMGRDLHAGRKYKTWMLEAGFVDVREEVFLVPMNGWPLDPKDKLLGNWFSLNALKYQDASKKLLELGGMPLKRIPEFLDQVRHNITDRKMRAYCPHIVVYGRKPEW